MSSLKPKKLEKGLYRHNKTGHIYKVLGVGIDTESDEQMVIYCRHDLQYGEPEYYLRPYEMFIELVVISGQSLPRFERVDLPNTQLV